MAGKMVLMVHVNLKTSTNKVCATCQTTQLCLFYGDKHCSGERNPSGHRIVEYLGSNKR